MKIIKTPRLIIRSLSLDDISDKYIEWLNDHEVNKYLETRFKIQDYKSCSEFVRRMQDGDDVELFGIFTKINNEHIGNCKLGPVNGFHHTSDISYFIGSKCFWGMGYATEVVNHVLEYGFGAMGLEKITAGCYESNIGSKNVLIKSGFKEEGFRKAQVVSGDHREGMYIFGIVKNEC
jgi:ribosomal-protein-alanine N-acetyltransferase